MTEGQISLSADVLNKEKHAVTVVTVTKEASDSGSWNSPGITLSVGRNQHTQVGPLPPMKSLMRTETVFVIS